MWARLSLVNKTLLDIEKPENWEAISAEGEEYFTPISKMPAYAFDLVINPDISLEKIENIEIHFAVAQT